ncbi:hypothetical protein MKX03_036177 [Papaver bracteatum]|nr:hypothetical protein MKX03_036177 [Papaver bracteatum]
MNNLRGFVSTAGLPSFAGNFNRDSLIHNGKGRDSPECVLGKAARPGKFQVKDKDLESDDSMMNLYGLGSTPWRLISLYGTREGI